MSLDLAIVTSCYNYGEYAADWAASILALTTPPARVCIVDNGSDDGSWDLLLDAAQTLRDGGLEVVTRRIPERVNFGRARNAAVELAQGHEWVQHLDIDDEAMPHMLDDVARLAPTADVVALGYVRFGDLKAGPRFKKRLYSRTQGVSTLKSKAPSSGVSPFRRSFWERSPYREDMPGGWDTALWLGFAHLEARFVPTTRPCFRYRQHADSVFNTRRKNPRLSKVVGYKLNQLRNAYSGVSVLVPWKPDHGPRDEAWRWVRERYAELHPEYEVIEGGCTREWRKGEAVRRALDRAHGDVLVIADADCIVPPEALEEAVELVRSHDAAWVVPHTFVHRLDEASSRRLIDSGDPEPVGLVRDAYKGFAGGGILVVERCAYEASGGIPRTFRGWGAEDEALAVILDTLVGPHARLAYDLTHLWHPSGRRQSHPNYRSNRSTYSTIQKLAGRPDALWSLLQNLDSGGVDPQNDSVVMVALMDFQHGERPVKEGETFTVTEIEARRISAQRRKVAERLSGPWREKLREDSRARTLVIRAEQKRRNAEARQEKDLRTRKLAAAGNRTKAKAAVDNP